MSQASNRLARRSLERAQALEVPELPDPDAPPPPCDEFARALGFAPDPWQHTVLTSTSKKIILCASRQSGKSTTTGIVALHEAIYQPGSLCLLLSPSLRQSAEMARKVTQLLNSLEDAPRLVSESSLRLELSNGSRVIALPGSEATVRGYSAATLVIVDEASRVPDSMIASVRPSLATTNGRLIVLSTPAGKRGFFWEQWSKGEGWERVFITAVDCPRITAEFLADERRVLGEWTYQQEYECQFLDETSAVFSSDLIERAMSDAVQPLWGQP